MTTDIPQNLPYSDLLFTGTSLYHKPPAPPASQAKAPKALTIALHWIQSKGTDSVDLLLVKCLTSIAVRNTEHHIYPNYNKVFKPHAPLHYVYYKMSWHYSFTGNLLLLIFLSYGHSKVIDTQVQCCPGFTVHSYNLITMSALAGWIPLDNGLYCKNSMTKHNLLIKAFTFHPRFLFMCMAAGLLKKKTVTASVMHPAIVFHFLFFSYS